MKRLLILLLTVALLLTAGGLSACRTSTPPELPGDRGSDITEPSVEVTEPGSATGSVDSELTATTQQEADSEPEPRIPVLETVKKTAAAGYTCGDSSVLYKLNRYTQQQYDDVCSRLKEEGYLLYSEWEVNSNCFRTYVKGSQMLHTGFFAATKTFHCTVSDHAERLPAAVSGTGKTREASVTQIYSGHLNGMGYIVRLEDGSFILYDGGYADCVEEIWKQLCLLNGGADGIVIRAWVLTHSHADHYAAFAPFGNQYGLKVTLETVMVAMPAQAHCENLYFHRHLRGAVDVYRNGADIPILNVHTGMVFRYPGARLEILCTPEELYIQSVPKDFNESSIISRVSTNSGSVVILGDAGITACNFTIDHFGDALKSDVVQVSHHGCETAPWTIYQKVAASVLFWPCDQALHDSTRNGLVKHRLQSLQSTKRNYLHDRESVTVVFSELRSLD